MREKLKVGPWLRLRVRIRRGLPVENSDPDASDWDPFARWPCAAKTFARTLTIGILSSNYRFGSYGSPPSSATRYQVVAVLPTRTKSGNCAANVPLLAFRLTSMSSYSSERFSDAVEELLYSNGLLIQLLRSVSACAGSPNPEMPR